MFVASDKSGPLKWNSFIVGERMSPVMSCVGSRWPSVREHTVSLKSESYRPDAVTELQKN